MNISFSGRKEGEGYTKNKQTNQHEQSSESVLRKMNSLVKLELCNLWKQVVKHWESRLELDCKGLVYH